MAVKETLTWRDSKGFTATSSFYVGGATVANEATAAEAIATAMAAITNAHLQIAKGPYGFSPTEVIYGTNAAFPTVEDKAIFTFQTSTGGIHRYQVPCPLGSIFLADGETVDATNTLVTAFTSAITSNALTASGEGVTFGGFGTRIRRKQRRRANIFTKDPTLTGPEE